jgi:leader peptidase (prepilin peptidase)/N-methyltransferase
LLDTIIETGPIAWSAMLFAPFIGSFLGVLIRRLPKGLPVAWVRSRCETCGARDLVPLLSWLVTRGRCRYCGRSAGWFYPAVELAAFAVALIAVLVDDGRAVWLDCVLGWWLITLAWIDIRCWLLPDILTLPLIIVGVAAAMLFDPGQLVDRAAGAACGYLVLVIVAILYQLWRRREGLGRGDAKLLAASGAWLGASALPQVIFMAAMAALVWAACLRLAGFRVAAQSALPFGPFLALATWILWLWGPFFV